MGDMLKYFNQPRSAQHMLIANIFAQADVGGIGGLPSAYTPFIQDAIMKHLSAK